VLNKAVQSTQRYKFGGCFELLRENEPYFGGLRIMAGWNWPRPSASERDFDMAISLSGFMSVW
jgi:hypothetical protein